MLRRLPVPARADSRQRLRLNALTFAFCLVFMIMSLLITARTVSAPMVPVAPQIVATAAAKSAVPVRSEAARPTAMPQANVSAKLQSPSQEAGRSAPVPKSVPTLVPAPTAAALPLALASLPAPAQTVAGQIDQTIQQAIEEGQFPGAVVLIAQQGTIVKLSAYGNAYQYADADSPLSQAVPTQPDTVFDLASVTKPFTAVAVMRLVEQGKVELDAPAARYLPQFAAQGKGEITVRQLLTHTSGLPAGFTGDRPRDTAAQIWQALWEQELESPPGEQYEYSDLGLIALGEIVHKVSGLTLDRFIAREITGPLGLMHTTYNPPSAWGDRVAATECQPAEKRGTLRGQVHDPNAWALGGVAGHAGLFGSAADLAAFGQMMLNGGELNGVRILKPETVALMTHAQGPGVPTDDVGLVWELNEDWYMGDLASPTTYGHTGYSGTSIVVSPERQLVVVLLTNRLHPADLHANLHQVRADISSLAAELAASLP